MGNVSSHILETGDDTNDILNALCWVGSKLSVGYFLDLLQGNSAAVLFGLLDQTLEPDDITENGDPILLLDVLSETLKSSEIGLDVSNAPLKRSNLNLLGSDGRDGKGPKQRW